MAEAAKKVSIKLLIDRKNDVVLFAEAGKDFIDFLFHILALPIGTVIRLLTKIRMVGSLGNLYDSIENLDGTYCVQPSSGNCNTVKDNLLKPNTPVYWGNTASSGVSLLLSPELTSSNDSQKTYYRCAGRSYGDCYLYVSLSPSATCPRCRSSMGHIATFVEEPQDQGAAAASGSGSGGGVSGGYVKEVVTYMVMDDLVVKPMSTISSITLLNKFNITNLSLLEEKVIDFCMNEGVALLKASLESKTVLTDVLLSRKMKTAQ